MDKHLEYANEEDFDFVFDYFCDSAIQLLEMNPKMFTLNHFTFFCFKKSKDLEKSNALIGKIFDIKKFSDKSFMEFVTYSEEMIGKEYNENWKKLLSKFIKEQNSIPSFEDDGLFIHCFNIIHSLSKFDAERAILKYELLNFSNPKQIIECFQILFNCMHLYKIGDILWVRNFI